MKNISFILLATSIVLATIVSCIAIGVAVTPDVNHIVIQAIEQNPKGDSNRYEWVMLYNPSDSSVNISNWTLVSHFWCGTNTTIVANTTLHPKKYLTVTPDKRWLHDEDASIMLIDAAGNVIDKTPFMMAN
ncbi:Lamin Tail Domain [Methanophagales archaeon]|nr:Lamin Tail Domain [Methanophagales archaeon]